MNDTLSFNLLNNLYSKNGSVLAYNNQGIHDFYSGKQIGLSNFQRYM